MTSNRKLAANRENAKKSTGPRSRTGKRSSRRNAFRHGLAIDPGSDPFLRADIELFVKQVISVSGKDAFGAFARQLAEAEIDLLRIRAVQTSLFKVLYAKQPDVQQSDYADLDINLAKLERYARRAFSRRRRALQAIIEG